MTGCKVILDSDAPRMRCSWDARVGRHVVWDTIDANLKLCESSPVTVFSKSYCSYSKQVCVDVCVCVCVCVCPTVLIASRFQFSPIRNELGAGLAVLVCIECRKHDCYRQSFIIRLPHASLP